MAKRDIRQVQGVLDPLQPSDPYRAVGDASLKKKPAEAI
jgi:hypothetical protein